MVGGRSIRSIPLICLLLLGLGFIAVTPESLAESGSGRLVFRATSPVPTSATVKTWIADSLRGPEVWAFADREEFATLLNLTPTPPPVAAELISRFKTGFAQSTVRRVREVGRFTPNVGGYVTVPAYLKSLIPPRALKAFFYLQFEKGNYFIPTLRFSTRADLENFFARAGVSQAVAQEILDSAFDVEGRPILVLDARLRKHLTPAFESALVEFAITDAVTLNRDATLDVDLIIDDNDNLFRIAQRFQGQRKLSDLLARLQEWRRQTPHGEIRKPLERLLGGFIEQNNNRYGCDGENCARSALSIAQSEPIQALITVDEFSELLQDNYVPVQGPLETDDLIVYRRQNGRIVHVSSYVTEEDGMQLVFSKNGYWRLKPHGFQWRTAVERAYQSDEIEVSHHRLGCAAHILSIPYFESYPHSIRAIP